jgi:urea transport system permease protein
MAANKTSRSLTIATWLIFACIGCTVVADDAAVRREMLRLTESDKETRVAAIQSLADSKDSRLAAFFDAYQLGKIYLWNGQLVLCEQMEIDAGLSVAPLSDPLTGKPLAEGDRRRIVGKGELTDTRPRRPERRLIVNAIRVLELYSPDRKKQLAAVVKLGGTRNADFLSHLRKVQQGESDHKVRHAIRESIALIRLAGVSDELTRGDRLAAAGELGEMCSARGAPALKTLLKKMDREKDESFDEEAHSTFQQALERIESYQRKVRMFGYVFSGLSLGSVLILMALGLSIIFGQMGVINMAHGELMMIGAYTTYEMQRLFGHSLPDHPANLFFVFAVPAAFCASAFVGWLMERLVVRRLYGRPLETLLATWGIGLVLIQIVRLRYGDNIGVNSPTWLVGSIEVFQDINLPYNRLFIIALTACCVLLVHWLMNYTRQGLLVRATVLNRETAASLGVNTRWADGFTFAFGAGLAGVAGCALTLIGGVTPDMGQNYIVDSFLVVVTGGVGELAGVVWAGLGIGALTKILEPIFATIWGKVLILLVVIVFIQWRPAGLFPPKGRLADV